MQLAMLAPYSNLATSVAAAALVPTLLGPKIKDSEENKSANVEGNSEYKGNCIMKYMITGTFKLISQKLKRIIKKY